MNRVLPTIGSLFKRDDGQDLIEYGLLAALIALVAVVGITAVGDAINTVFWQVIADAF